ncbi:MAG: shikimate dehydrogenase [Lachnospiraceae bacterium]|nr:shikimate dehydrogenase [Lachnospiraceae bacterium]
MKKYCVIGTPVGHSKSPELFQRFITEKGLRYGVDAVYLRNEIIDTTQLHSFVMKLKAGEWSGCNVTMPWKTEMVRYMDELSETARLTGAVNTVSSKNGKLYGDSTDGKGMLNAIKEDTGTDVKGKNVAIIGCGGAARSILAEMIVRGASDIKIICRDVRMLHRVPIKEDLQGISEYIDTLKDGSNVKLTLQMLLRSDLSGSRVMFVDDSETELICATLKGADILINSTPLGMLDGRGNEEKLPLPENTEFLSKLIVADCVYNPDETLLIKKAKESGCKTVKGIRMLEEQARCGVEVLI